jgi:two-component system nitrate/nitrite response regulator NarL
MLTVSEDERDLAAALRGGARGYLLKTMDSEMLASGHPAHDGRRIGGQPGDDQQAGQCLPDRAGRRGRPPPAVDADPIHSLSPREREILALIAKGASNKELARALTLPKPR